MMRPTWAEVDLAAVRANIGFIQRSVAPSTVCAVVKADAYGHGAVDVARAALAAGASWLAVALVEEARVLRDAGIDAPILLLSEPPRDAMNEAYELSVRPMLYSCEGAQRAAHVARRAAPWAVHLKVDTGMHRVGAQPDEAIEIAKAIAREPHLRFEGLCTHLAVADEAADPFTAVQLERFERVRAALAAAELVPDIVHAANSGGALLHPASRYDMVRVGISVYGYSPTPADHALASALVPALRLVSRVSHVKTVEAGEGVSYGRRWIADRPTRVATVPAGYADGVRRILGLRGGAVLIGGRRRPIVGVVTMDQLMVACDDDVHVGDEVVLIGEQGDERITADEVAALLGTISYEVLCDIGPRVPRVVRS